MSSPTRRPSEVRYEVETHGPAYHVVIRIGPRGGRRSILVYRNEAGAVHVMRQLNGRSSNEV